MKLNILEKIQLCLAYKYAKKRDFKKNISKIKYGKNGKKTLTTSKVVLFYIFINLTIVEIFSLIFIWVCKDSSALAMLISSVVGEGFAYAVYSAKALKENLSKYNNTSSCDNVEG